MKCRNEMCQCFLLVGEEQGSGYTLTRLALL